MKKKSDKKEQSAKQKEFSATPFKALKGLALERPKQPSAPEPPKRKEPKPAADEELFWRAVEGVKRLEPSASAASGEKKTPPPPPRKKFEDEDKKLFLDALKTMDVRFEDELPDDVQPLRPAVSSRMRRLKSGAIRIAMELDLHGLTREEALDNLKRFVTGAYNRGQSAVLVITGKGNKSPGEPVLQAAVAGWLREQGKGMVAEFSPAPGKLGGSGAFVVFLKAKPEEPETV